MSSSSCACDEYSKLSSHTAGKLKALWVNIFMYLRVLATEIRNNSDTQQTLCVLKTSGQKVAKILSKACKRKNSLELENLFCTLLNNLQNTLTSNNACCHVNEFIHNSEKISLFLGPLLGRKSCNIHMNICYFLLVNQNCNFNKLTKNISAFPLGSDKIIGEKLDLTTLQGQTLNPNALVNVTADTNTIPAQNVNFNPITGNNLPNQVSSIGLVNLPNQKQIPIRAILPPENRYSQLPQITPTNAGNYLLLVNPSGNEKIIALSRAATVGFFQSKTGLLVIQTSNSICVSAIPGDWSGGVATQKYDLNIVFNKKCIVPPKSGMVPDLYATGPLIGTSDAYYLDDRDYDTFFLAWAAGNTSVPYLGTLPVDKLVKINLGSSTTPTTIQGGNLQSPIILQPTQGTELSGYILYK